MALALKFEHMIRQAVVPDYAVLAAVGRVSRARVTQIMNLLNLAPDIQEQILFLTWEAAERNGICEQAANFHGFPDAGLGARTVRRRGLEGHAGQRCCLLLRWFYRIRRRSRRRSRPWGGSLVLATFVEDTQESCPPVYLIDSPSIDFMLLCCLHATLQAVEDRVPAPIVRKNFQHVQ
jgi:hypothetical protein